MAAELPYFKFEPGEWQSGMIQLCSLESKGLFIELCCLYWTRLGDLPYALALQKLCHGNATLLQELENNQIYEIEGSNIIIKFLNEQLNEFQETSKKRAKAANKRWSKANEMQVHSKSNAIREDKSREDKKTIDERKEDFKKILTPFKDHYSSDILNDFYGYWTEYGPRDKKMRFEKEKSFDPTRRLQTWSRNESIFKQKNGSLNNSNPSIRNR
jgi:hypothetical protein